MEQSRINQLLNVVSLKDVISEHTQMRPETAETIENVARAVTGSDFELPPVQESARHVPVIEDDYDAESNARSLVYTLTSLDSIALNMVAPLKVRHSAGGKKAIAKMRNAVIKKMAGSPLTEADQILVGNFDKYKGDLALLSDELICTPKQIEQMIEVAIPYCEETRFKVNSSMAFWSFYAGSLVERITKILTK